MNVAVVGASGLIGSAFCQRAASAGWTVTRMSVRGSVPAGEDGLADDFVAADPDVVIFCAACRNPRHGPTAWEAQMNGTIAPAVRVALAVPTSVRLAVFLGSCEEYGNTTPPFTEDGPLKAFSPYGWAKISAFEAVSLIARQRGFSLTWARPFLTFGPGQHGDLLIPSMIEACIADQSIDLTPGAQTRDFVYVGDVASMLMTLVSHPERAAGMVLNLASGTPRSVRDVGETIRRLVGKGRLNWGALPYRFDEAMNFYASMERWQAAFGLPLLTPFEDSLQSTINAAIKVRTS